jgi:hypothetical protein
MWPSLMSRNGVKKAAPFDRGGKTRLYAYNYYFLFDAFSRREPVSTSLENALPY